MAKIVYGIQGEGRGHSSRSKIIIEQLLKQGYEVKVFASRKAYNYLKEFFPVKKITGLQLAYDEQSVNIWETLQKNFENVGQNGYQTLKTLFEEIAEFKPDVAITDFEPFVPFVSALNRVPFISISHQHIITKCNLEFPQQWNTDYQIAYNIIFGMYRGTKQHFITSFYFPEIKKQEKNITFVGPILREEVLKQKPKNNRHILVYVTHKDNKTTLSMLKKFKKTFHAYGFGREGKSGNIVFKKPSTEGFLQDLATADAVITNGGFSLMSEALFLGKPIYSLPLNQQFEQMINGYYLEKNGYGLYDLKPSKERLKMFFEGLEYYRKNIKRDKARFFGNKELFKKLEKVISEVKKK